MVYINSIAHVSNFQSRICSLYDLWLPLGQYNNILSSDFNNNWMAITLVLDSLAQTLLYIHVGAFEFIMSQSLTPYSMRGLSWIWS